MKWTKRVADGLLSIQIPDDLRSESEKTTTPEYIQGADNRRKLFVENDNIPFQPKMPFPLLGDESLWEEKEQQDAITQNDGKLTYMTELFPSLLLGEKQKIDIKEGDESCTKLKESNRSLLALNKSFCGGEQMNDKLTNSIDEINKSVDQCMNTERQMQGDKSMLGESNSNTFIKPSNTLRTIGYGKSISNKVESPFKRMTTRKQENIESQDKNLQSPITKIRTINTKPKVTKETLNKFQISLLTKKFINKILKKSSIFVFRSVKNNPFNLIQDSTYSYNDFIRQRRVNQNSFASVNFQTLEQSTLQIYFPLINQKTLIVINQESKGKFVFDLLAFILIIFNIVYLPIKHSFQQELDSFGKGIIEQITLYFMMVEIFFNMSTQYYRRAVLVKDRFLVMKKYISTRLWMDIVVGIPLILSVQNLDLDKLNLLYLIRIFDFLEIFNKIEKIVLTHSQFGDFLKCLLLIFFVAHLSACSIHYISTLPSLINQDSYLDLLPVDKSQWFQVYVYSFYWSIITMTTIGYGDIRPNSHIERIYATFFAILSCVVFGFTLNQIGSIMSNIYINSAQFRRSQAIMDSFLKRRKISPELQIKVQKNLEYIHNDNDDEANSVRTVINSLTSSLQEELKIELYSQIINTQKTFKQNFSKEFLKELALYFKEEIISQEEIIFQEKDKSDRLYFIIRGNVELFLQKRKCPVTIGKGEMLGLDTFFSQKEWEMEAKTSRVTSVAYIEYQDFLEILNKFPNDLETYRMIYDSQNLYANPSRLSIKCYNCSNQFHSIDRCPYLYLTIDKNQHLSKVMYQRSLDKIKVPDITIKRRHDKSNALVEQQELWNAVFSIFNDPSFHSFFNATEPKKSKIGTDDEDEEDSENNSYSQDTNEEDLEQLSYSSSDDLDDTLSKKSKKNKKNVSKQITDQTTPKQEEKNKNAFFLKLQSELSKQGINHVNSMGKSNPLLQQFFGGQHQSSQVDIIKEVNANQNNSKGEEIENLETSIQIQEQNENQDLLQKIQENREIKSSLSQVQIDQQYNQDHQIHSPNTPKEHTNLAINQNAVSKKSHSFEVEQEFFAQIRPLNTGDNHIQFNLFHHQAILPFQCKKGSQFSKNATLEEDQSPQQNIKKQLLTQNGVGSSNISNGVFGSDQQQLSNNTSRGFGIAQQVSINQFNDEIFNQHLQQQSPKQASTSSFNQNFAEQDPEKQLAQHTQKKQSFCVENAELQGIDHKDNDNQTDLQFDLGLDPSNNNYIKKRTNSKICKELEKIGADQIIDLNKETLVIVKQKTNIINIQCDQSNYENNDLNALQQKEKIILQQILNNGNNQKCNNIAKQPQNNEVPLIPIQALHQNDKNAEKFKKPSDSSKKSRSSKKEKTFLEFCKLKMENETNQEKKQIVAQILERTNIGTQKKLSFEVDGIKSKKNITKNSPEAGGAKKKQSCLKNPTTQKELGNSQEMDDLLLNNQPKLSKKGVSAKYPQDSLKQKYPAGEGQNNYSQQNSNLDTLTAPVRGISTRKHQKQETHLPKSEYGIKRHISIYKRKNNKLETVMKDNIEPITQKHQQNDFQSQEQNTTFAQTPHPNSSTNNQEGFSMFNSFQYETQQFKNEEKVIHFFVLPEFDAMKVFKIYFPLNNYYRVIKNIGGTKRRKNITFGQLDPNKFKLLKPQPIPKE